MESVASNFDKVFALANLLRTCWFTQKRKRKRLKGSWRELLGYLNEYKNI